jgi:FkbH-like protein
MVLKLDDVAAWEVNWEPKGTTIARLAEALNLGIDSFVFFDDNPAEREQVRQALPEVTVVEVPEDPAEYVRALQAGLWFEAAQLTEADRVRTDQYVVERKRRALQETLSMDDYLRSLEMVAAVGAIDEADLQRVVQLLAKTNQFNLTTRRHTRDDVLGLLGRPGAIGLTVRVRDRFGDHGLVAALIGVPDEAWGESTLRIDTWLMSCRVIGRTVEQFSLGALWERARALGYRGIVGEYIATPKNALVRPLYESLGFRPISADTAPAGSTFHEIDIESHDPPVSFVATERPFAPVLHS